MRVKYILFGISLVTVGIAWALTHKHPYKTHANREAAASFSTQACTTNTVLHIIEASPDIGHPKAVTLTEQARLERVFRFKTPDIVKSLSDKLQSDPETLSYLRELSLRTKEPPKKNGIDPDLKRELKFFAKEVYLDMKALCPHSLPASETDEPYAEYAIITIVGAFSDIPLSKPAETPPPAATDAAAQ